MTNRELQKQKSSDLITKVFVYNALEAEIYAILKSRKINLALLAESIGMPRNTAYYKLKKTTFSSLELSKLAQKAKEIYFV